MSYTNVELLRNFIDAPFPVQSRVSDQAVVLRGGDESTFFGGVVEENSLRVKGVHSGELTRLAATFNSAAIILSAVPLIPGTVLVASDSSLGAIYSEGSDFTVDYETATVTLKDGGVLSVGQSVCIWFEEYHIYQSGADYVMNAAGGSVRRSTSSDIADGETVYLDYTPVFASYKDEVLNLAVAQANGMIEKAVDPNGQFGADAGLQAAATYRALEIVCRASAGRQLAGGNQDSAIAKTWMSLGDYYAARSEELISSFRPPLTGPSSPTLS